MRSFPPLRRGGTLFAPLAKGVAVFPPLAKGVAVFPPLAKGGLGGVVPARPVTRSSHALSLSVLSHPSREARRIVFAFQGSRIPPPGPPFARGGKGSLARNVIPSRATKTRVSKPPLQLGQRQLLTGPVEDRPPGRPQPQGERNHAGDSSIDHNLARTPDGSRLGRPAASALAPQEIDARTTRRPSPAVPDHLDRRQPGRFGRGLRDLGRPALRHHPG